MAVEPTTPRAVAFVDGQHLSAYPHVAGLRRNFGVDRTDWLPLDQATYDACRDPNDYRSRPGGAP